MGPAPRYTNGQIGSLPLAKRTELAKGCIYHKFRDEKAAEWYDRRRGGHVELARAPQETEDSSSTLKNTLGHYKRKSASAKYPTPRANGGRRRPKSDLKFESKFGFSFRQQNHYSEFERLVKDEWKKTNKMGFPDEQCYTETFHGVFLDIFYNKYQVTEADVQKPPRRVL